MLPFIASVNMNVPFPSVLSGYFWSFLSFLPVLIPYFLLGLPPFLLFIFNCLFLCFCVPFLLPTSNIVYLHLSCCRRLTSVSWDHPRQQMPTACSVDRWGQFTCLERLSALLRSWLFINWVRVTRLEGTQPWMSVR